MVQINIEKKDLYILTALMILLMGTTMIIAFGSNNPTLNGHDLGEIQLPNCAEGQVLKLTSGNWVCGTDISGGGSAPNYDSGWVYIPSVSQEHTFNHALGVVPSNIMLLTCGALSGSTCTTRVVMSSLSGHNDGATNKNPISVTSDNNNIYIATASSWQVFYYWIPASWVCTGDADGNCATGYYKVLAWN
jgi:hypothetical protein